MRKHDVTLLIIVSTGLRLSAGDVNMVLQRSPSGIMCRNRQVNNGAAEGAAEGAQAKGATIPSKALRKRRNQRQRRSAAEAPTQARPSTLVGGRLETAGGEHARGALGRRDHCLNPDFGECAWSPSGNNAS